MSCRPEPPAVLTTHTPTGVTWVSLPPDLRVPLPTHSQAHPQGHVQDLALGDRDMTPRDARGTG